MPHIPTVLETKHDARIWFDLLKLHCDASMPQADPNSESMQIWTQLALKMEEITTRAQEQYSLNQQDMENAIARELLPLFFSEDAPAGTHDLSRAQAVSDAVIQSLRVRRQG